MSLKLFRSTGYSSILGPGETRVAPHPAWLVLAVSLWIGFVCNVALWRQLRGMDGATGLGRALLAGALIAGTCGAVLSLLGWRRSLKRVATVMLLLAALVAACIWVQGLPLDRTLLEQGLRALVLPSWPSLLRWQFPALLIALGVVPALWLSQWRLRRLAAKQQMSANMTGLAVGIATMVLVGWFLLARG
ncbi:phosphoethanolamine transferase domain-containing protein [Caenimonas terrae]|uniref:Phosphoethanolamine transferase domain-containing protein n=1 Tax=Caenimonas terrae TaxID=696074 RepID=A0ABW0NK08_9BURK